MGGGKEYDPVIIPSVFPRPWSLGPMLGPIIFLFYINNPLKTLPNRCATPLTTLPFTLTLEEYANGDVFQRDLLRIWTWKNKRVMMYGVPLGLKLVALLYN